MSLSRALRDSSETLPANTDRFLEHVPNEWLNAAAELSSQVTIRRRRLPSDQVMWLVLGMAFFRNKPIAEVARSLNISADGLANEQMLAKSALTQARQRLGAEPMQCLFQQSGKHWGVERYPQDDWHGLQVFAVDGALFRTPDSTELRSHFGSGNTSTDRQTPFPMLRCVALMNVRSHVIVDACISPYRRGEVPLAMPLIHKLPDHSITLLDKGFYSADLLVSLASSGVDRHWLLPARKGLVSTVVEDYGAGDRLVEMKVSPQARKKNPSLPESWCARAITYEVEGKEKTVFTSLPASVYTAKAIAELYHQRWEIELGFRDIKSSMLDNAIVLRSKTPALVYQELWGLLLAYNLIRREASQAAVEHKRAPQEISFKFACQFIAAELISLSNNPSPGTTGRRLADLRGSLGMLFKENRPRPSRPRSVKLSKTRYPVNRNAAPLK
ncbi:IS4 family transposase [Idiomarina tyrosinivorans]|uniref:IS4 family transposase n=1 Tax=Idiomarina tyrosinivorans TaxID=1445662 RepID=A0A432ZF42_9GAMM|nr:IS4 family transposase [Idiomarina tyrosinivorans]RUO76541.1 IS4 family transposase [Idiomarina tyrosinivorans]